MRGKLREAAIVAVGAVIVSLVAPVGASAARPGPEVTSLQWQGCGGPFECATARVPLDYDRPAGRHPHDRDVADDDDDEEDEDEARLIPIALIRLPASD